MHISPTIRGIQSPIIQELQKEFTPSTLSLAQGVPFFPPPERALELLKDRLGDARSHGYSLDAGLQELRVALAEKLRRENGLDIGPDQVMVTAGANQAFMNVILTIAGPGDELILLVPYYFNHEMALRMLGITPRFVGIRSDFQPDVEALRHAITPRTRAIVTVSPNNPTGAVYEQGVLREIGELCREAGIFHISDEAYEYFIYGEEPHHSPGTGSGEGSTINLFSFSKAYGMAGWRVGYMTYPEELGEELLKVQDTVVICPSVPSQLLALECLEIGKEYLEPFLPVIRDSRAVLLAHLKELGGIITLPETTGGFYVYPKVGTVLTGRELAFSLIRDHEVAVVPGEAFGSDGGCYLRLSYGNVAPEVAEEGMRRFVKGVRELARG